MTKLYYIYVPSSRYDSQVDESPAGFEERQVFDVKTEISGLSRHFEVIVSWVERLIMTELQLSVMTVERSRVRIIYDKS